MAADVTAFAQKQENGDLINVWITVTDGDDVFTVTIPVHASFKSGEFEVGPFTVFLELSGNGVVPGSVVITKFPPPVVEEPTFVSAEVTWSNENLQDKNNDNFRFTVTVTMSDGSTFDVDHAETVNGQESGRATFNYDDYSVFVRWNDNNRVTACRVV